MRPVLVALAAVALSACAGKLEKVTRTQAAADFKCDADKLKVRGDEVYGKYHVAGCGQKGVYSAQCLMGDCSAQRLQGE
ncbi:hypothetical protein OV079_05415 [Nannocystis pusilla]|uniref:Lipoprotein n=1 Tax=Nannocystis pusilla TaxID=889268 RepID=A0A9X3EJ43_9BACT|nr:hypothetical protein [Nannocystis pusilla]MCY1005017.1 hypothetical protein [Nannocystis pusilla]